MKVHVAVPTPIKGLFTYESTVPIAPGTRVLVPFGRRQMVGVTVSPPGSERPGAVADGPAKPAYALKNIDKILDAAPMYSAVLLDLAQWLASYYMHPVGEVLKAMLPASGGMGKAVYYTPGKNLHKGVAPTDGSLGLLETSEDAQLQFVRDTFAKRSRITAATFRKNLRAHVSSGANAPSEGDEESSDNNDSVSTLIAHFVKKGYLGQEFVATESTRKHAESTSEANLGDGASTRGRPNLTDAQQIALTQMLESLKAQDASITRPRLLLGVTGSGKTEVYLHVIAGLLDLSADAQVLVMVPEIALTPQMTRVFEDRFAGQVAVVHSAMTDTDRWEQLMRIKSQQARILIGPRSAVFAPFANLKLMIVDEEHDSSYKQTTGLCYHGRDVAVMRGKMESAMVLLGSATPSLESYQNALSGKYDLLELPKRATGRPLPEVSIIKTAPAHSRGVQVQRGDLNVSALAPIDSQVIDALAANVAQKQQAIVLVNRRGYAYYLFSLTQKKAVPCPSCSISLTLHQKSNILRCHYCDYQTTLAKIMALHPQDQFVTVGYGSEKAEETLIKMLPQARIERLDSDVLEDRRKLPEILDRFRNQDIDILCGTQILAKGHDFPNVTLTAILEVDQLLDMPDFRAGERTFQLMVQASGRAGRAQHPGRVLVQCMRPNHPVILSGLAQDFRAFADRELEFRKAHGYPPFGRMIALEFNDEDKSLVVNLAAKIEGWLEQFAKLQPGLMEKVRVLGPSVPPIEVIRGRMRRVVLFSSADMTAMRQVVDCVMTMMGKPAGDMRFKVDVDPQTLL